MDPRIAILLPTYEPNPAHLREAIEGLLAQTEQGWMAFIHDDASAADVEAMVRPYLSDPRFTFERSAKRLGIGGNWNICREWGLETDAPFLQYLFQDDLWEPTYLERTLGAFDTHPQVGMVTILHAYRCEEPEVRGLYDAYATARAASASGPHEGKNFLQQWLLQGLHPNLIGEPSFVMLRREVVERAGPFLEDMPQLLDLEYWVRALPLTQWFLLHEELGTFRVHAAGASERNRREGAGLFDRLRCLEIALHRLSPGPMRQAANEALVTQIANMITKFRQRTITGGKVGGGRRVLFSFALRHPFIITRSLLRALAKRP